MSDQSPNEGLPESLRTFGTILLALSLVAAAVAAYYAFRSPQSYFPIFLGTSIAAVIHGIGVKLVFSFLAEVVASLHAITASQHGRTVDSKVTDEATPKYQDKLGAALGLAE